MKTGVNSASRAKEKSPLKRRKLQQEVQQSIPANDRISITVTDTEESKNTEVPTSLRLT